MNYFQLFALPEQFSVDLKNLSEVYQRLQKSAHPDKFASASSQEQLIAVQQSSKINDAYQTLKAPLLRAEYLLELRNTPLPNEQETIGDMRFLMRQMELREMLEEISHSSNIDAALFEASQALDSEYEILFKQLQSELLTNTDASNVKAGESVRKLKFYQKLQVELERVEESLFND